MIKAYSVENFKSIKLKETISFEASTYKNRDIKLINNNLLPTIVLYGPNGGGKSNLIESFYFLITYFKNNNNVQTINQIFNKLKVLKHINRQDDPITWDIEIISTNKNEYRYHFSLNEKDGSINEYLYCKEYDANKNTREKLVFKRDANTVYGGSSLPKETKLSGFVAMNSFLFSAIAFHENELIIDFYKNLINIQVINNAFNHPILSPLKFHEYNFDKHLLIKEEKRFLSIFKDLDINIVGIFMQKNMLGQEILGFKKIINNKEVELPFESESEGTKKIIQLLTIFIKGMHNNELFVIDELDSRLHTKLLGYVIDMFNYQEKTCSQLLFTSHDMGTLSTDYFREDEIYFAALNESNFTDIICLSEFGSEIRTKSSISNKYLNGDLGYDPYIKRAKEKYGK